MANFVISVEQSRSAAYQKTVADEIEAGRYVDDEALAGFRINHPCIISYKTRLLLGREPRLNGPHYRRYSEWTSFLPEQFGKRERCLSLGSGIGRVEKFLIEEGFTERFETIELNPHSNRRAAARGGIATSDGDLNFVSLPEKAYDFILCNGILHHLINLEHVLYEVNKALEPSGMVMIYEYIGETRWQFSEERMRIVRRELPHWRYKVPPRWQVTGFESVRSSDLLRLVNAQFAGRCERLVTYGGVYAPFLGCVQTLDGIELAVAADERLTQEEAIAPCYMVGIYRKTAIPPLHAVPWSDADVVRNLLPHAPMTHRIKMAVKKTRIGVFLRNVRRRNRRRI